LTQDPKAASSWHLFVVLVENSGERKIIFDGLRQEGILVNVHYRPIYRQSFYSNMNKYDPRDFPGAERYYSSAISLPIFPGLEERYVEKIVHLLAPRTGYQGIF
jgi:dTDP-4-amino-4,6-dideoxygalactose transaminase